MAIIGYARVSTTHQKLDSQISALKEYGVDKIYTEYESGTVKARPILEEVLRTLNTGDTLVIFKLDRLARGTQHLLQLVDFFEREGIKFVSVQNQIDTSTPIGKLLFTIMSAFAEMEASLIRERVCAGLKTAKENGKTLGRPPLKDEVEEALNLYTNSDVDIAEIVSLCGISKSTLYRHIKLRELPFRS